MSISLEDLKTDLDTALVNRAHHIKEAAEADGMIKLLQGQINMIFKRQTDAAQSLPPADNGATTDENLPTLEEVNQPNAETPEVNNG